MIDIKRILFPVDMSDEDRKAAPFVKAMADWFGSKIHLLYVQDDLLPCYGAPDSVTAESIEIVEETKKQRRAEFEAFARSEFAERIPCQTVEQGDAAHEIAAYAKKKDMNLIMMPTHGYGAFRRFLLGSVTAKVLHDVACPVWTGVHTAELDSENPAKCERLLCAVDTEQRDVRVIRWAADFARQRGCEVRLVHAVQAAPDKEDEDEHQFRESLFKFAHDIIRGLQKEAGTAFEVEVRGGKPEHVVRDAAEDLGADLLVIGRGELNHPLGRLRTHTYSIIRESPRPVISV